MSIVRDYTDLVAPRIFVEANGTLANDIIPFITKFEYEDDEAKIDKLTLTVANPGLRFRDDARFKEGVQFRVRFGYLNDISDMKVATIAHSRPHFAEGMPSIQMVALNLQHTMNRGAAPRNWGTVSSTAVVREIAKKYGFELDIEESNDARRQSRVQAANVTDFQFMMNLAKKLNWDCFIEYHTLHFHKKRYTAPAELEFVYFTDSRGTLLKFDPDVNLTAPLKTGKSGADTKTGDHASGGRDEGTLARAIVTGEGVTAGTFRRPPKNESGLTSPSHETDPKVIAAHGSAHAEAVDMNAVKATADMIGTPRLRARTMIRIAGVDQQYCGNWRVSKSKHTIEPKGVYRVSVNLKRDAGKAKAKDHNMHNKNGDGSGGAKEKRLAIDSNNGAIAGEFSK